MTIYVVKRSENVLHMAIYEAQLRLSWNVQLKRGISIYVAYT